MGGSTYSRRKKQVYPSKREPEYVLAGKWFRGVIPEERQWSQEELKHTYDIKQIPIDKLYTVKNKTPYKAIQRERESHDKMNDYEPISVIKRGKQYIVISGNERVIALASRGYKRIKARVYDLNKK